MKEEQATKGAVVDVEAMIPLFPTHRHSAEFWEALGRAVATFGFLEEALVKAIFCFTATKQIPREDVDGAIAAWLPKLQKALSDTLGSLVATYCKSVRDHQDAKIENFDELDGELQRAAVLRNVLCHGSWGAPDEQGRSLPFFVNRQQEKFEDRIDIEYLQTVQRNVAELAFEVIKTVTHMGWQFPGSNGPGVPIAPFSEGDS